MSHPDPPLCPTCGAGAARPIVYGMPTADDFDRLADDVVFAGCCLPADPPAWSCRRCQATWGSLYDGEPR